MKKLLGNILITLLLCLINGNVAMSQNWTNTTTLYPIEASATKYGQTIKMPDLSGLPLFSATYEQSANRIIVRRGDRKLTLYPSNNNNYYNSGQYGNLKYSMSAIVHNGTVQKLIYTEVEDNIKVEIKYSIK